MKRLSVMRLALGYAGMFFGAGFVSGQEIRQFFVVYGTAGLFGLVLSALLFFAVGVLFFETARQSPEQTVTLVSGADVLCAACPHLLNGVCASAEKVSAMDAAVREIVGETEGTWAFLADKARAEILRTEQFHHICGNCEWYALCRRTEEHHVSENNT